MNGSSNKCKRTYYCTYPSKNFHSLFLSFSASSSEVSFFEQRTTINPITTFKREITKAQPKPIFLLLPIMPTPNAKATAIINKNPRSINYKYLVVIINMPKLPRTTFRSVYIILKITFRYNSIRIIFSYYIFCRSTIKKNIHIFIIGDKLYEY